MTALQMAKKLGLPVSVSGENEDILHVLVCDLLSHALIRLEKGDIWITVQNHINVAAIAYQCECRCILIAGGIVPDVKLCQKAKEHGMIVLQSPLESFEVGLEIQNILG